MSNMRLQIRDVCSCLNQAHHGHCRQVLHTA
jgi:hypothetical protein